MVNDEAAYQAILEICRKSQEIVSVRTKDVGDREALVDTELHEPMWENFFARYGERLEFTRADFSSLLFHHARFDDFIFTDCDFRGSRWVFSSFHRCDLSGSNFAGAWAILGPFIECDCTSCDLTSSSLLNFSPLGKNVFRNANFSGAKLDSSSSFFDESRTEEKSDFAGASMDGCALTIKSENNPEHNKKPAQVKAVLQEVFTPEQLAAMRVDTSGISRCFVATAACGEDSPEVLTLRSFRDDVMMGSAAGRLLVKAYCRVSPPLASLISGSPGACGVVRTVLIRPIARMVSKSLPSER